jgi:T3SS (YopN, CesT) and YbjN peptide-binding chaperone 1
VQRGTPAQQQLHAQVGAWLHSAFGDAVSEAPDEPAYFVARGTIGVRVNIEPIGGDDAVIEAYSWIGQGLAATPEVGLFLAERNAELRFGALSIDGEGAIILGHALFADGADRAVLGRLVTILAESAQALDEELRARF